MSFQKSSLLLVVAFLAAGSRTSSSAPEPPRPTGNNDCGAVALCMLLQMEGRPAALDDVLENLHAAPPGGYTLADLASVASGYGLELLGVKLSGSPKDLDRPALAFIKEHGGGHYVVVRPVGHTGTLVQVLDNHGPPTVWNADVLFGASDWTGLALVPVRHRGPGLGYVAGLLGTAAAASLLLCRTVGRRAGSRVYCELPSGGIRE